MRGIHICARCTETNADYCDDEGFTWHSECWERYQRERRIGGAVQLLLAAVAIIAVVIFISVLVLN